MHFGSALAKELCMAIRKDPSWAMQRWGKKRVNDLLLTLTRHVKVDGVGRQRREAAFYRIFSRVFIQ